MKRIYKSRSLFVTSSGKIQTLNLASGALKNQPKQKSGRAIALPAPTSPSPSAVPVLKVLLPWLVTNQIYKPSYLATCSLNWLSIVYVPRWTPPSRRAVPLHPKDSHSVTHARVAIRSARHLPSSVANIVLPSTVNLHECCLDISVTKADEDMFTSKQ